jgi:hypothetical protein
MSILFGRPSRASALVVVLVLAGLARSAMAVTVEPPGPSSRKTPFVISEIMYNPAVITVVTNGATNNLSTEFLEIYNSNPFFEDLSGFRVTGEIDFTFPKGTSLAGRARLVLAKNPTEFQQYYQIPGTTVLGYTGSLSRAGTLQLRNNSGGVVFQVDYDSNQPWPVGADGTGHSLVLARPSYGENDPSAWSSSDHVGGSPGANENYVADPLRDVVINEILAHTDPPLADTIELYNHSNQTRDLSGCVLSDEADQFKFTIPAGTVVPPRGFVIFNQTQLGFALSTFGETIYFWNSNRTRLLDTVQFGPQENAVSVGRYPDGGGEFYRLQSRTLGTNNSDVRVSGVVLNELMYDPISGNNADEYVELYNRTAAPVNLSGWRLEDGISFTIPTNTVLAANGYLVIAANLTNLLARYPQLNAANTLGNYSGSLRNSGERIALSQPDTTDGTNVIHIVVDEVAYRPGGQWPVWARGGGSSLERREARANSRLAANWADSDETTKAPWTTIEVTDVLSLGSGSANAIEGGLQGEGECLLDDVEVIYNGLNQVPNSTFAAGLTGCGLRGNHIRSSLNASEGFGGGQGLQVRASGRADTGANRLYAALNTTIPNGSTATIRAKARWQRGWPELLLRLHGNFLEAPALLTLPTNLGTPGLVNSRASANIGPAIHSVMHSPVLPAAGQAVVVTAQAHDPDGLFTFQLKYRVDPSPGSATLNLTDTGAGGDAIAGDGIYSATIPGQASGTLVAFVIMAADNSPAHVASQFPTNTPANSPLPRECLVRFGEPQRVSNFGTYHQWFTAAAISAWTDRLVLSNEGIEGTFVYGNFRAVYNFSSRYAGSPYHQGWSAPTADCHYSLAMPRDNLVLGTENFNKIHAPGNNPFSDGFLAREQTGHWIARQLGVPWTYRRFVNVYVNGNLRKANFLMEDVQVPGSDFIEEYYPEDANGDLRKINPWFEMNDGAVGTLSFANVSWAALMRFEAPAGSGNLKPARYRWNWQGRAYSSTANEFANVFRLIDAANSPAGPALTANLEAEADLEQWFRVWAARHTCGDWDFFGSQNAQNSYAYRPQNGRWQLFTWDMNIIIGNSSSFAPGMGLFPPPGGHWGGGDTNMTKLYNHPPLRRMYWRAYKELCQGALQPTNVNAYLNSRYSAFLSDGLGVTSPDATFSFTDDRSLEYGTNVPFTGSVRSFLSDARTRILARLALEDAAGFTVNGSPAFATNASLITFSGSAPVEIKTITINGNAYPVTWLTASTWTMSVPLAAGVNTLEFAAWDFYGHPLTNFSKTVTVNYTGLTAAPEAAVGFNEIMPRPVTPGAEFVELFNRATNAFDLSGWRVNGLGYTFPAGSFIPPQGYLVLTKDWHAYAKTYGLTNLPFGLFSGNLDPDGETLTLFRPGALPGEELVVDRVRYEAAAPWPITANGVSLQLRDAAQDNSRVANWMAVNANLPAGQAWLNYANSWRYWQTSNLDGVNWRATSYNDSAWPGGPGVLGFETAALPEPIRTSLTVANGRTTFYFRTSFNFTGQLAGASLKLTTLLDDGAVVYLNGTEIFRHRLAAGAITYTNLASNVGEASLEGPFFFTPTNLVAGTNVLAVEVHQSSLTSSDIAFALKVDSEYLAANNPRATPGAVNSVATTLPPFPPVWLNELQVVNLTGLADNFGGRDPWTEIFNAGTNSLNLAGYYLSDTYTNLTKWAFPGTANVAAGNHLVVWCDAQSAQSIVGVPHTSFRLTNSFGQLALSRITNGAPQLVDYLTYTNLPANWSYGDYPDGQPFFRPTMFHATPGAANTNTSPPINVFINEWLADNAGTLADPADSQFEDWFEIYNPGPNSVDLGGYYLTDSLNNPFKFQIPNNSHYLIPPGGFLLVWADNEAIQNSTNLTDLHVNFALSKDGEALGLFGADGVAVDAATFGPQTTDVSEGRFPDGAANIFNMPTRTPRLHNLIPNSAPVLAAMSDKFGYAGQTLQFIVSATDAESLVQTLTFNLIAPPAGATLHPGTGAFVWNIPPHTIPGTNLVTIQATDDGTPVLSDVKNFNVIIRPVPQLASSVSGNQLQLSWPALETGWWLEAQTNSLSVGLDGNWFPIPGSSETNQIFLPINPAHGSVFLRLVAP